jgi:BirA family biotin operon repressor/biotin-[acetyl-CoA-carboxylase] ligase
MTPYAPLAPSRVRLPASWPLAELHCLGSVGSTNDEAAALARAGAPHGTVVACEAQTRGRGRQGHKWYSPPGENVYLSVVLRPALAPAAAPPLTLVAGVALSDALSAFGVRAALKWPNDLLVAGKKIAGILTEMTTRDQHLEFVVVGLGVNLNTPEFPGELGAIATSLARERQEPIDREAFVTRLLGDLERWLDVFVEEGAGTLVRAWKERTCTLGQRVRVLQGGVPVVGVAQDVDDDGALLLLAEDGRYVRILSGEITPD